MPRKRQNLEKTGVFWQVTCLTVVHKLAENDDPVGSGKSPSLSQMHTLSNKRTVACMERNEILNAHPDQTSEKDALPDWNEVRSTTALGGLPQ
jgi:hypothetical protein